VNFYILGGKLVSLYYFEKANICTSTGSVANSLNIEREALNIEREALNLEREALNLEPFEREAIELI